MDSGCWSFDFGGGGVLILGVLEFGFAVVEFWFVGGQGVVVWIHSVGVLILGVVLFWGCWSFDLRWWSFGL